MTNISFNLGLSFLFILISGINSTNSRFSVKAATIRESSPSKLNLPNHNFYSYEGKRGRNGRHGRSGESGKSGVDKKITIDGSAVNLDLSGTDGRDGEYGRDGYDARCSSFDLRDKSELRLASGGNGGNGGNGGDGGDGGSLTVVYSQLEHLRQINVQAAGGYGGRGADGGRAGRGCVCPNWIYGFSGIKSERKKIYCRSGKDGRWGRNGRDGRDGELGRLYLIEQGKDLLPDLPSANISLFSVASGKPTTLTKNIWESRSGAGNLLHPNSIIADTYEEYIDRLSRQVNPVWNESRPITDFENQELELELTETNELLINYPEEVWLDTTVSTTNGNTLLTINHAVAEDETTGLARGLVSGNRSNLLFRVIDQNRKSDILTTQFKIKYRTSSDRFAERRNSTRYKTRYEGIIPAAAITQENQYFNLALGQLPIDNEYLRPGTAIEVELTIIRFLGDNSAEQKITWSGEIEN